MVCYIVILSNDKARPHRRDKMDKLIGTYKGDGYFSFMPIYDEKTQYNFEKDEFIDSADFDEIEIDYDAMYNNPEFQKDLRLYRVNNKFRSA
jgi:hypothetical protein